MDRTETSKEEVESSTTAKNLQEKKSSQTQHEMQASSPVQASSSMQASSSVQANIQQRGLQNNTPPNDIDYYMQLLSEGQDNMLPRRKLNIISNNKLF